MGYTTEFDGSVSISPPYFVDGSGPFGQGHDDDIRDFSGVPALHIRP